MMSDFMSAQSNTIQIPEDRNKRLYMPNGQMSKPPGYGDDSKYLTIWPNNIDSLKTIKMGRMLPTKECNPKPTIQDISCALNSLSLRHIQEPFKMYPRDPDSHFDNIGRVKVEIFDSYGNPLLSNISNKKELLIIIGMLLPENKQRNDRIEAENAKNNLRLEEEKREDKVRAMEEKKKKEVKVVGGNNKKKGKKGR